MRTTQTKLKSRAAFTITEVMIAAVIVLIAIIGTSENRYDAVLNARKADLHATAVRTALLLCEAWNGTCGSASFDPYNTFRSDNIFHTGLDIIKSEGPAAPDDFTILGNSSYKIMIEGVDYYATLSWQSTDSDLRILSVIVNWDPTGQGNGSIESAAKSYELLTYVENPG